jgi:hypothetical protein
MSDKEYQQSEAQPAPRTPLNFPTFIAGLFGPITLTQVEWAGQVLRAMCPLVEDLAPKSQRLPARVRRSMDELRREWTRLEAEYERLRDWIAPAPGATAVSAPVPMAAGNASSSPSTESSGHRFDPRVVMLVMLNYWHLVKIAGRDAAVAELTTLVKRLTKKPMGRPRSRPVAVTQRALELRERGRTYGQIAREVGFKDGKHARSVLKHDFPGDATTKKSR